MSKKIIVVVIGLIALIVLVVCVIKAMVPSASDPIINTQPLSSPDSVTQQPATPEVTVQPTPSATAPSTMLEDRVKQLLEELTISQKIGQLLIVGIEGKKLTKDTQQFLTNHHLGSIILFKRNITNEKQLRSLTQQLKEQVSNDAVPLWISIDQEGGIVNRLPKAYPSAEELAALHDVAKTFNSALDMGKSLADYDIDMDFAPVLDINSNPKNPIIGSRSFGTEPEGATNHALAMMKGLQEHVFTVGKHFPGHGDTDEDSHYMLPTIHKSWEQLKEFELIPFQAAIDQHIDAIMVGHLLLPEVDPDYPASLSTEIVQHRLREEMEFNGLVISDDMEMEGITDHYSIKEASILAVKAGVDMLIVGHQQSAQLDVITALNEAVLSGEISLDMLNERVERVLLTKLKHLY